MHTVPTNLTLTCPVRGLLKTAAKSKDGLKPLEEYFRVEAIRALINQGYPKEHFKIEAVVKRFGNQGRNSMRADFAVLDVPVTTIAKNNVDELLDHAILLCEVKRENERAEFIKETQVKPLLDFAKLDKCIALYWDNVDQRIFWRETIDGKKQVKEGGLALLPKFGGSVKVKQLTFADTVATDSLLDLFSRIEDLLHGAAIDPEQRYSVILQLLLAKSFDEHGHQAKSGAALEIQDFGSLGHNGTTALAQFNATLARAVGF
jgi:type I restriction enzyme M protein